jgi:hypothetical protein
MSGTTIPSTFRHHNDRYTNEATIDETPRNHYSDNNISSNTYSNNGGVNRYTNSSDVDTINNDTHLNGEKKYGYADGESNGAPSPPVYKVPSNVIDTQPGKPKQPIMTRIMHSFRRREEAVTLNALGQKVLKDDPEKNGPGRGGQPVPVDGPGGPVGNDTSRLNRQLKGRHLQMIAIGGSIGTGLFIGSGSALASGGPAAVMIDFGIIGIMLFCVIHALGELAVLFPISGISFKYVN